MARKKERPAKSPPALTRKQKLNLYNVAGTIVVVVFAALVLYAVVFAGARRPSAARTRQLAQQAENAGRSQNECPQGPGQDWEYDEATRCYFDPSPGHGHWHVGRPPSPTERASRMAGAPPAAAPVEITPAATPAPSPLDSEP